MHRATTDKEIAQLETTEGKDIAAVERARQAQQLLENPLIKEFFAQGELAVLEKLGGAADGTAVTEAVAVAVEDMRTMRKLRDHLFRAVADGAKPGANIKLLEERRKAANVAHQRRGG